MLKKLYKLVNSALDRKQPTSFPDPDTNMQDLAIQFNNFFLNKVEKIRTNMSQELPPNFSNFAGHSTLSVFEPTNLEEILTIIKESGIKTSPDDRLPCKAPLIVNLVNNSLQSGPWRD